MLSAPSSSRFDDLPDYDYGSKGDAEPAIAASAIAKSNTDLVTVTGVVDPSEFPPCGDPATKACFEVTINQQLLSTSDTFSLLDMLFKRRGAEGRTIMFEV